MNSYKNKNIITRRAFFRQLHDKTVPFLALLSVSPLLLSSCEKELDEDDCKNECKSSCSNSCAGSCEGLCAVACGGLCAQSCKYISK